MIPELTGLPLLDGYRKVSDYATGFETGEQPDWMVNNSSGGTITYETTNGGRARINTGTASTGDNAEIQFGSGGSSVSITPDNYDAIRIETTVSAADPDSTIEEFVTQFYNSPGNILKLSYGGDFLRTANGGGGTNHQAPVKDHQTGPIRNQLIWDIKADTVVALIGGMATAEVDVSATPNASLSFIPIIFKLGTSDTSADREAYLHSAKMEFYQS